MEEDFSSEELYSCLLKWLENCLALGGILSFEPGDVNDGNSLAECLVQLVPEFFTSTWRARIITVTGGNWKLKLNNLKKIHHSIQDYYSSTLHLSLDNFSQPNLSLIAESRSKADIACLIQLVLGIAINCEQKNTYIQAIMGLQKDVQHVVMGAIQNLMSLQSPSMVSADEYRALEEQSKQTMKELHELKVEGDSLLQQKHDMTQQLSASQCMITDLSNEVESLKANLTEAQSSTGVSEDVKVHQLQRSLGLGKVEKLKLETERDDHKQKLEELALQMQQLMERNRELQLENEEIPVLKDSMEEMKYLESKVKNYESVISQYKKKVEDAQELRKQLKATEDRNIMYMQQNLDLEEELRRQGRLKMQLDTNRQKVHELENALAQEKLRGLETSQDAEEKGLIVDNLQAELVQVKRDRDNYSQQVPGTPLSGEFSMFSSKHNHQLVAPVGSYSEPDLGDIGGVCGLTEAYTPELREKMVRLDKENQILRKRLESVESAPLEVEEAWPRGVTEQLSKEMAELQQRLSRAEKVAKKYAAQVASLQESKKAKEQEIDKYKKYLNKAKKIIENIGESKTQPEDSLEMQTLRNQLKDREKHIEQLDKEFLQARSLWEREEKLVVSAWHELGLMMHQKFFQERQLAKQSSTSFLAQQRQALYRKPVSLNTSLTTILSSAAPAEGDGHS